jgi:hypothetical protein
VARHPMAYDTLVSPLALQIEGRTRLEDVPMGLGREAVRPGRLLELLQVQGSSS